MAAVAALLESRAALLALRRSLGGKPPAVLCRTLAALSRLADTRLLDAVVLAPHPALLGQLEEVRARHPVLPVIGYAPFRPDDGDLLLACRRYGIRAVAVEGVDDAVVGDLVLRHSMTAERQRALAGAPRLLRLTEPLQQEAWAALVADVERPVRTNELARRLGVSREHLSRQFGAGGAPNLKRVIDLTRVASAAQLLAAAGYSVATVARLLHFASSSHLSGTSRRIAGVAARALGGLGAAGVLAAFVRGHTRSRE